MRQSLAIRPIFIAFLVVLYFLSPSMNTAVITTGNFLWIRGTKLLNFSRYSPAQWTMSMLHVKNVERPRPRPDTQPNLRLRRTSHSTVEALEAAAAAVAGIINCSARVKCTQTRQTDRQTDYGDGSAAADLVVRTPD